MLETELKNRVAVNPYSFKQTEDRRWGIYMEDRLLATVGSYEACVSISKTLSGNLSREDLLKAKMAFKGSINRSLIIR